MSADPNGGVILTSLTPRAFWLRARLWWNSPHNLQHQRLIGPSDWELAGMSEMQQVPHFARVVPVSSVLDNARRDCFFGYRDDEALAIEASDAATRSLLTRQLLRHRTGTNGLRESMAWLLSYALFEREGFAEALFETKDETEVFRGLRIRNPSTVHRAGRDYVYDASRELGYVSPETRPRRISPETMIDLRREVPVASELTVRAVLDACWEDRLINHASLAAMQAAAEPHRAGLRWDAARMRRDRTALRHLLSARVTYELGGSLIHHALFFSEPGFTREFYLWQHHRAMSRLGELRDRLIELVNAKVVSRLMRANRLVGEARLIAVGVKSQAELDDLFEKARRGTDPPFKFYEATVPAYLNLMTPNVDDEVSNRSGETSEETALEERDPDLET